MGKKSNKKHKTPAKDDSRYIGWLWQQTGSKDLEAKKKDLKKHGQDWEDRGLDLIKKNGGRIPYVRERKEKIGSLDVGAKEPAHPKNLVKTRRHQPKSKQFLPIKGEWLSKDG